VILRPANLHPDLADPTPVPLSKGQGQQKGAATKGVTGFIESDQQIGVNRRPLYFIGNSESDLQL
jgi:hypothetical protein